MTTVVHCKRDEYDVYVGRGSIWGNPFRIGRFPLVNDGTRAEVIEKYEAYIRGRPDLLEQLPSLVGKRLGCYCYPLACHGDVLIKLLKERGLI